MSEEKNNHDNTDSSNSEEEVISTEPESETGLVAEPELEPEVEIISSVTEKSGVEEAATEEAMGEQFETSDVEHPQLISQAKPEKQTTKTIMKINRSLADASKQIERQTTQINKLNQDLQSLQKQMSVGQRQTEIVNELRSQLNQIQKQVSQVHKSIQKRSYPMSQKSSKRGIRRYKSKSKK